MMINEYIILNDKNATSNLSFTIKKIFAIYVNKVWAM
jgi:hypothetical protein